MILKEELAELESLETKLDRQLSYAKQSIHNITDDMDNKNVSFLTHDDLCAVYPNSTLLVIQAPSGTQLEVPNFAAIASQNNPNQPANATYTYGSSGTHHDLILKQNKQVITSLRPRKYQMHLKSRSGPINVFLVNQSEDVIKTPILLSSLNPDPEPIADTNSKSDAVESMDTDHEVPVPATTSVEIVMGSGEATLIPVVGPKLPAPPKLKLMHPAVMEMSQNEPSRDMRPVTRCSTRGSGKRSDDSSPEKTVPSSPVVPYAVVFETIGDSPVKDKKLKDLPSLRLLSPRKAAQKHLFVNSKRGVQPDSPSSSQSSYATAASSSSQTRGGRSSSQIRAAASETLSPVKMELDSDGASQVVALGNATAASTDEDSLDDENKAVNNTWKLLSLQAAKRQKLMLIHEMMVNTGIIDHVVPDVQAPLVRLSPPPSSRDYCFNLDESEGATDLFGLM